MSEVDLRLERLLGGAALAPLRARLRSRYQRGRAGGTVTLGKLGEAERAALAGLLGRRPSAAGSLRFDISELDARLRDAGLASSLRHALELLDGPVTDLAAARAETTRAWDAVRAQASDSRLSAFLANGRGLGLLKRLAARQPAAEYLIAQVQAVLAQLPAQAIPRSHLAAKVLGDAHALDPGSPVATIVLAVLRNARAGGDEQEAEETARALWAETGVLVNELARPVLFLNLPGSVADRKGDPDYLSLRALLRAPPEWQLASRDVYVCENPNLVAIAADALGPQCAPLVCTDGMPAAAQRALLSQLAAAGACLHYHGDFDWPGIAIANTVIDLFSAVPWRFSAADYCAALDEEVEVTRPLVGLAAEARWDKALTAAMRERGRAIDEEALAASLVKDLDLRAKTGLADSSAVLL
ncbi:TIGR02679 family protein [Massilia alkalitolerans]|uniref:TIGR02679 family protein n=1 Tax=Massilia alkalitolerans TaxID=286638 RepID=UPI0028ADEC33|nr:TIGR02679 family protein [Massilia alkalitolerans]